MTDRSAVAAHLPFLRRYARALTGSQERGDGYVRATLEALISGESVMNDGFSPRVALYRAFQSVCGAAAALDRGESMAFAGAPERRLLGLSPAPREALLLSVVEGFPYQQVGQILGVSAEEAEQLAVEAQAEIERDLATDVLVIEDEAIIAMDIADLAEELGHRVLAIASTREEAVAEARKRRPGLVLADIQLADESLGTDAVSDILELFDVPVVFITAFPERLLTGESVEPTYLVTKPFDRNALKATIAQALFFHRPRLAA
jgi:DNA-directed RNA polymerase specialized sigma24 family protein